jgi:hypothetical protein
MAARKYSKAASKKGKPAMHERKRGTLKRSKAGSRPLLSAYRKLAGRERRCLARKIASLMNQAWHDMFVPTHSLLEMFLRGTSMYLTIFLLLRFVLKRQTARHPGHPAH